MISALTNLSELVGIHQYARQTAAVNRSMERLATGKRINRAADDPAGLIAANDFAARSAVWPRTTNGSRRPSPACTSSSSRAS